MPDLAHYQRDEEPVGKSVMLFWKMCNAGSVTHVFDYDP
jgi:hypothetical protein